MSACFNIPLYFCRTRCSFVHQALPRRVRELKEWAWFWNWWRRGTSCRYFWVLPVDSKTHTASPLCITVVWLTTSVALSSLSHCWHFYVINWKHDYKTLTGQRKWVNVDNWQHFPCLEKFNIAWDSKSVRILSKKAKLMLIWTKTFDLTVTEIRVA